MKDECNLLRNARGHLDFGYRLTILLTDLIRNSFNNGSSENGWQHTEILLTGSISISIMRFFFHTLQFVFNGQPHHLAVILDMQYLWASHGAAFLYLYLRFLHSALKSACTSGVGENGLGGFASIAAAGVIVRETLVTGPGHQFQILGRVFNNIQRFHLEHLPAAGVWKVHGAVHRAGGEVILVSGAVAEGKKGRKTLESIKLRERARFQ